LKDKGVEVSAPVVHEWMNAVSLYLTTWMECAGTNRTAFVKCGRNRRSNFDANIKTSLLSVPLVMLTASIWAAQAQSPPKPAVINVTGHYRLTKEEFRNRLDVQQLAGGKINSIVGAVGQLQQSG